MIKYLLGRRQLHVNERDVSGRTALHWAVACGALECVEAMVTARRFTICVQSNDGDTPLHLACREGLMPVRSIFVSLLMTDKFIDGIIYVIC